MAAKFPGEAAEVGVVLGGGSVVGQRGPAPSCALTWGRAPSSLGFLGWVFLVLPRLATADAASEVPGL